MKKECDANGLEYELMMQESAKERFMREIKGNPVDFSKHLVILKQKRQSAASSTEPTVAAPAPSSEAPVVAAAEPESPAPKDADEKVGAPLSAALASFRGKAAIAGNSGFGTLTAPKLLVQLRERLGNIRTPATRTPAKINLPRLTATATTAAAPRISFPPLPKLQPLIVQPNGLF